MEQALHELAKMPGAVLAAATDADRPGDGYAARLEAMATTAGVRFERLRPPTEDEDWNQVLKRQKSA